MRSTSFRASAALAICSLATGLSAALAPTAGAQTATQVTLLNINDFHGHLENAVNLAGTVEALKAQYPGAEFTSAGDNVGGSPFVSAYKQDQPTIEVLNAMNLKTSALGNHEFDKGIADLQGRIEPAAKWDYLGANVVVNGQTMKGYEILTINGKRVGVVGAVTAETKSLVSPSAIPGVEFTNAVDAVNRVAAQLSDGNEANGEADVVVAEYHDGAAVSSTIGEGVAATTSFADIVNKTSKDVDAIFNGHTHQTYAWDAPKPGGGTRPVVQAASYGTLVGRITLNIAADGTVTAEGATHKVVAPVDPANPVVTAVRTIVDANAAEAKTVGEQPVGTVKGDITTAYSGGKRDDRLSESTLGNLVSHFMIEAVAQRGGADIALMKPGGLRAELFNDPAGADGNITKAEANSVLPFANTLVTSEMTGAQIKEVLEQQWQPAGSSRPFLALGASQGLTWTYDPTRAAGDHITSIALNGKALDMGATYKVVTQSFLAGGGDNFTAFAKATNVKDTGLIDSEAWQAYLTAHRAAGISPDYGRHAVAVKNLPTAAKAGDQLSFTVTDLDLTSLGVPAATKVTIALDGKEIGTAPVTTGVDTTTFGAGAHPTPFDGRADITVTVPAGTRTGAMMLTVTTDTGTVITIPLNTTGLPSSDPRFDSILSSEGLGLGSVGSSNSTGSLGSSAGLGSSN